MGIINTIEGNLITLAQSGRYTEIAHGCNCFCVMGAGIAPQIAKAFPEAEEADNETEKGSPRKLGMMSIGVHKLPDEDFTLKVINMYTQYGTGGRAKGIPDIDYKALEKAFRMANYFTKLKMEDGLYKRAPLMGIPMIGAGLAGGDWDEISEIINRSTPDMNLELVVYKG